MVFLGNVFFHVTKERQTDDDGRGEVLVVDDGPFHTQGRLGKDVSIAQVTMYNCFLEKGGGEGCSSCRTPWQE